MLIYNDLSDWLLLGHLDLFCGSVVEGAVVAVTHHHVECSPVAMEDDTDHLVVVVELLLRWVLVVLYSFNFLWSNMRGESIAKKCWRIDRSLWLSYDNWNRGIGFDNVRRLQGG